MTPQPLQGRTRLIERTFKAVTVGDVVRTMNGALGALDREVVGTFPSGPGEQLALVLADGATIYGRPNRPIWLTVAATIVDCHNEAYLPEVGWAADRAAEALVRAEAVARGFDPEDIADVEAI